MADQRNETEQAELLGLVRLMMREAAQLRARLDKLEEKADSLQQYASELERKLDGNCEPQAKSSHRYTPSRGSSCRRSPIRQLVSSSAKLQMRLLAEKGTDDLEMRFLADGSASIRIDRGKDFGLPPLLAGLLSILVVDNKQSDDDKVGWKTWKEVAILLGRKATKTFKHHTIIALVSRLRIAIALCGGANPYLVQTDKTLGMRLAFKRTAKAVIVKESM